MSDTQTAKLSTGAAQRSSGFWLAVVLLAVVAVRIFVAAFLLPEMSSDLRGLYRAGINPDFYDHIAANLARGNGYRVFPDTTVTMFREPGYVLALAGIFRLFGENYLVGRLFNLAFSIVAAALLYRIGRHAGFDQRTSALAVGLFLVHPATVIADSRLGVESLLIMLLLATIHLMYLAQVRRNLIWFALAGLLAALTALTRTTTLPFFVLWCGYLLLVARRRPGARPVLPGVILFIVVLTAIFSAWPIRNYRLSGQPVVTATVAGDALYLSAYISRHYRIGEDYGQVVGNGTRAEERFLAERGMQTREYKFHATIAEELEHQRLLTDSAIETYRQEPGLFLRNVARNAVGFWIQGGSVKSTLLNATMNIIVLTLAGLGLARALRRKYLVAPMLLFVAAYYTVHIPILATVRYHLPTVPILMLFVALMPVMWLEHVRKKR